MPVALVGASDDLGGFRHSFPIVVSYLDQQFENVAEHTFDGRFPIRLLVNRDARVTRPVPALGLALFSTVTGGR